MELVITRHVKQINRGLILLFLMLLLIPIESCFVKPYRVSIIHSDYGLNSPALHGINRIYNELEAKKIRLKLGSNSMAGKSDFYILAGVVSEDNQATRLMKEMHLTVPDKKEALLIRKITFNEKPTVLICGSDEVGLMYAALDVAKRISWGENPADLFEYVAEVTEAPKVEERCVSTGTFQRKYFEQRLHDSIYWETYFDMMAENRLNQFLLIFGYKNNQMQEPNFMAPAYPNFFNVDSFPFVRLSNVTIEQQQKNTNSLKTIINLAHARGIEFGVGLWDQIERDKRYNAMVRDDIPLPDDFPANIIWGLTQENLIPYTKTALRQFFNTFPNIDLVQFRMHWEAGITGDVALQFWKEIFEILKDECPDIKIEARAKDVPDETLYDGVETGMDFRVATKYWMEQMGMPFHPTHINRDDQLNRRHGYADLLRYPKMYGFKWRIWSGGTTRVFLWGDPDWVATFSEASRLYDARGFEFNEPLYFKMNGSKHEAEVSNLLNPENRYYTYEFERYWHYYQVMGRVSYNPETSADIWEMEFSKRFGKNAGHFLMEGLHKASKILPRIVSASYLYSRFPSPQGWPELQRMGDLKHFALNSKPSDIQQFSSPKEEVQHILSGAFSVKREASRTSEWFSQISKHILSDVEQAEKSIGNNQSKEYAATVTDLKMLAHLAMYHSQRLKAAVQYNLYSNTGDLNAFDSALLYESEAVKAYEKLVWAAGKNYNMQLDFGSNKELFPGHWRNELARLKKELEQLHAERDKQELDNKKEHLVAHIPLQRVLLNDEIIIHATVRPENSIESVKVKYATGKGSEFKSVEMNFKKEGICSTEIPNPGKDEIIRYYLEVSYKTGRKRTYPENGASFPFEMIVCNDREAPVARLDRIATAKLNQDLNVSAEVVDASGVQNVVLRFRNVNQFEDYKSMQMVYNPSSKKYEACIPSEFCDGKYDVMYFIEVMDDKGNGAIYPDLEREIPYVIVHFER